VTSVISTSFRWYRAMTMQRIALIAPSRYGLLGAEVMNILLDD